MAELANGFAAVLNNKIDVRTVSPTRRAATVNYLVVCAGRIITNSMTDKDIEAVFMRYHGGASILPVEICVAT